MKTWDQIDINSKLTLEEFLILFDQINLDDAEKFWLREDFYLAYEILIRKGMKPKDAWLKMKNAFLKARINK